MHPSTLPRVRGLEKAGSCFQPFHCCVTVVLTCISRRENTQRFQLGRRKKSAGFRDDTSKTTHGIQTVSSRRLFTKTMWELRPPSIRTQINGPRFV